MVHRAYVVFRGYRPGIYTSWQDAKAQVNGFPNNLVRRFTTVDAAKAAYERFIYICKHVSETRQAYASEAIVVGEASDINYHDQPPSAKRARIESSSSPAEQSEDNEVVETKTCTLDECLQNRYEAALAKGEVIELLDDDEEDEKEERQQLQQQGGHGDKKFNFADTNSIVGTKSAPCALFLAGKCKADASCRYSHDRLAIFGGNATRAFRTMPAMPPPVAKLATLPGSVSRFTYVRHSLDADYRSSTQGQTTFIPPFPQCANSISVPTSFTASAPPEITDRFQLQYNTTGKNKLRAVMGRLIGKRGVRIEAIRKQTEAQIYIDNGTGNVTIKGSHVAVKAARKLVEEASRA